MGQYGCMKEPRKAYQSDLSDAEWQILKPLLPGPRADGRGRPMLHDLREIVNAILYILRTGIQWRLMPHDLPPWPTVYYHFRKWRKNGVWEKINTALREQLRVQEGKASTPSAAIIDSQSVKGSMNKGVQGFDGAKNIKGRKRHLAVDTLGLLLVVVVTAADVAEREGARKLFAKLAQGYKRLKLIWADAGYQGEDFVAWVQRTYQWLLEIVKRPEGLKRFVLLPRRWVVERTIGWLGNYRRLAKDYEECTKTSEAMVYAAMSHLMLRRLAGSDIPCFRA